jgi:pimeloyl-ACP methyl ester carboxylesterase
MAAAIYHDFPLARREKKRLVPRMRFVWLHGFASGPTSGKGQYVRERLAGRGLRLELPDLNQPTFRDLTVTRMLGQLDALLGGEAPVLFGSSLGGYTAALWAARHPVASLVLLAPAFDLARRWKQATPAADLARWRAEGEALVDHHAWGREEPLAIGFLDDAERYEAFPLPRAPTLVLQGMRDEVVAPDLAAEFARRVRERGTSVRLVELPDGHELSADLPRLWREIEQHLAGAGQLPRPTP